MYNYVLLGDKGYLHESILLDLFKKVKVKLEKPKKMNEKTINHHIKYRDKEG
ncbi:hypothetical protein [Flavobacterium sp. N1994]|uniref:hypothetical protein n=1 Tax=Flavobacterium sp. N1994 TaxID=2986827 RepID=UPI00222227FE|nr:hypothetical protein [Flavobacterium sp. N1994]